MESSVSEYKKVWIYNGVWKKFYCPLDEELNVKSSEIRDGVVAKLRKLGIDEANIQYHKSIQVE
jgi:hypothetical protein